ncbi:MAG: hypothetical protein K0R65_1187 [Crocinitomicaceae bacterium]|jgi:N-dimethylarginine dimethylaminohydrolase|nr:hypothetical protein [Crocinitomicaceae bacterium]
MKYTCHSETGKIKRIIIKPAENAFDSDSRLEREWKNLNFLGKPDFGGALSEYRDFEAYIRQSGAQIDYLPQAEISIDSIYCRDASIATDFGMILCTMGKENRLDEPAEARKLYESLGIQILGEITAPGTVEGGDVAWLDEKTLAVGHTYRTNEEGIAQLRNLLEPHGVSVVSYSLPHFRGQSDVFHLMSIFSPVAKNIAVVYSPLMPISFRNELLKRGYRLVEVPEEEYDSMGCNVLALEDSVCLMVKGNPVTKQRLLDAGCTVHEYTGNEISVKGGGGPTCLTRPLERLAD